MARTALIYHYFERDETYRDNFIFFLSRAWSPDIEMFILVAGRHSVDLPERSNIHYFSTPNFGHDFGSYCFLVEAGVLNNYDRLIFVNCSVRGPFLPPYAACMPWTAPFLQLLEGDVHLCGATINILHDDRLPHQLFKARYPGVTPPFSHVQSSVHAMTAECFSFLRDGGLYNNRRTMDKNSAIVEFEIAMSQRVRAHGWNIACLLPPYNAIDYRRPHCDVNPATTTGHPQARGAYFGLSPHPYELVFVKTNWGVLDPKALAFHSLMALRHHPRTSLEWGEGGAMAHRLTNQLDLSLAIPPTKPVLPSTPAPG